MVLFACCIPARNSCSPYYSVKFPWIIRKRAKSAAVYCSDDGKKETFPEVVSNLSRAGIKPLLVTNAGIYGIDNRPLGLLISPKGRLHDADTKTDTRAAHGNFSWDSAVFQISDDGIASIVPVRNWQDS